MAWVDEQGATDLEVAGAVLADEPGVERYEQIEVFRRQIEGGGVVAIDEPVRRNSFGR